MQPLVLFFGLMVIPRYAFDWVMTLAQIELMMSDRPLTFYKREKKKDKDGFTEPSREALEDAMNKYADMVNTELKFNIKDYR